jgi:four helix bundle protein
MRRAAVSVPSNIAEGAARLSTAEFIRYLIIARASLSELDTQIQISRRLGFLAADGNLDELTDRTLAKLGVLLRALQVKSEKPL